MRAGVDQQEDEGGHKLICTGWTILGDSQGSCEDGGREGGGEKGTGKTGKRRRNPQFIQRMRYRTVLLSAYTFSCPTQRECITCTCR